VGKIVGRVAREPQQGPSMPKFLKPFIILVAAAAAAATFGVGTAQASKCSAALIHDWLDGRIDQTYPVHCYQEAIKSIPEDQLIYGSLRDDLKRALQSAIRNNNGPIDPNMMVPGAGPGGPSGGGGGGGGIFRWLARTLGPGTATSIPIPLLVLGGLALALMAAAGISLFARRYQARRAATDPPPPHGL
jgi:hypothetical protein